MSLEPKEKHSGEFENEYERLNKEQREAVNSIEGPVMVVAGPGTGKTQILTLRIGNILLKTDTKADSILCLTFTNSAVKAMQDRLRRYIGPEAFKVKVATFHSFGAELLSKFHKVLGIQNEPGLMEERDMILLYDEVLSGGSWQYIRPRSDPARHFRDLKSMISLLKRERIAPLNFKKEIKKEIKKIENDPDSVSKRGGGIKKEAEKDIEDLHKSLEAAEFYRLYEDEKKKRNLFDYDDILESMILIMQKSEEAKSFVLENFLYVLVDEHQDSSRLQNEFLQTVWGEVEKPNVFVVGDDRQLIYGFGGASLEYFENFKNVFGPAKLISLVENYRSTKDILDSSHDLLQSVLTKEKLKSQRKESYPLRLVETYYPADEIVAAGLEIKEKLEKGEDANDMAILVPKNHHVRRAITILSEMGLPVAGGEMINFFDVPPARPFIEVLKILVNPEDNVALAMSMFSKYSGILPLKAHRFLKNSYLREFSLHKVEAERDTLFEGVSEVNNWLSKLKAWSKLPQNNLHSFIETVGFEFLLRTSAPHQELIQRIEVIRTLLNLVTVLTERNPDLSLLELLKTLERLEKYGENVPLLVFAPDEGMKVLTLHGSKGLEFDFVWIAHMDERSFAGGRIGGFRLPEPIREKVEKRDEEVLKRQLYVAITRAKRFCTVSYARESHAGTSQELASILDEIQKNFQKQSAEDTDKKIKKSDGVLFKEPAGLKDLVKLVSEDYKNKKVSASLLNNFFECPWKWYFRSLLSMPERESASLKFGNKVHSAIDQILKSHNVVLPEDKEVAQVVSRWVENRFKDISQNRENEYPISLKDPKFSHLNIYGKIDLLEKLDEKNIRVTDFKTGSVRPKGEIEKLDDEGRLSGLMRQLTMYSYLLQSSPSWRGVNVSESRLEFLEAKSERERIYNYAVGEEEIVRLIKDIGDYDYLVKNGGWVNRPCNYNSYGKNTECEYCSMANVFKKS